MGRVYVLVYVCVYMHACMHVCMQVSVCVYAGVDMCVRTFMCVLCAHMHACVYVCVCVYNCRCPPKQLHHSAFLLGDEFSLCHHSCPD